MSHSPKLPSDLRYYAGILRMTVPYAAVHAAAVHMLEAADAIAALEEDADRRFFMLTELLVVIHRDRGQYQNQHGMEKAWTDAMQLSSERIASGDELTAEVARLRGRAEDYRALLQKLHDKWLSDDWITDQEEMASATSAALQSASLASQGEGDG